MDHKSSEWGHTKIWEEWERVNHKSNMLYEKLYMEQKKRKYMLKNNKQTKINRKQN